MSDATSKPCTTCYGAGETVTEEGPTACPDCFGDGKLPVGGMKLEWRLRQIEGAGAPSESDVRWLVHELRRSRDTLVYVLTRCQDADDGDEMASDIKYRINETLGLYDVPRS